MRFKLIVAMVDEKDTEAIVKVAREAGATGSTVISSARGEGLKPEKTFLGLNLTGHRDLLMFVVAEQLSRTILEKIAQEGNFDAAPGSGIAFQIDIEDAVGLRSQLDTISSEIEDQI